MLARRVSRKARRRIIQRESRLASCGCQAISAGVSTCGTGCRSRCPEPANYDVSIDLWKKIVEWRLGTLPSVGSARSVGQCTQHFLFIHYGDKAICPLHASVDQTKVAEDYWNRFVKNGRGERCAGGIRLVAAFRADQRLGCDIACAPPPLAPPLQGGERCAGGFRFVAAFRSDQRLGCDIACAPPPLAPPLQGGERCAGGIRLVAAFRADQRLGCDIAWPPTPLAPSSKGGGASQHTRGKSSSLDREFSTAQGRPLRPARNPEWSWPDAHVFSPFFGRGASKSTISIELVVASVATRKKIPGFLAGEMAKSGKPAAYYL